MILRTLNNFLGNEIYTNAIFSFIIKIFSISLGYFYIYYISKNFGPQIVGIVNIANSLLMITSLFATLGFEQSILRFAGQFIDKRAIFFSIYKKMFLLIFISSFFLTIIIFFYRDIFAIFLTKNVSNSSIFGLISVAICFLALTSLNVEAIRGLLYVKQSEIFRTFTTNFINVILFFLLLMFLEFRIELPIITNIVAIITTFIISTFFLLKKFYIKKKPLNDKDKISFSELLQISIPMFIVGIASLISNYFPVIFLAYIKVPKDVGIFNIAYKIATITSFFLVSINSIVAPKISESYWSGKINDLKNIIILSAKLNFWSSTPLLLSFILFPKFFMGLFGDEFVAGYRALIILSIGQFVNAFCGSVGYLLTMTGNQDVFRNIYFISTILNLLLCFILIPLLGVDGAALSFSISMIFWNVLSLIIVKKKFGFVTYYLPFLKNE